MEDTEKRVERLLGELGNASGQAIADRLGLTRQAVNRHLKHLVERGSVAKSGTTRNARYVLTGRERAASTAAFRRRYPTDGLQEDRVFDELSLFLGLRAATSPAAFESYHYALTEIVNNAVEHSQSTACTVEGTVEDYWASFSVEDGGIGIFKSIADRFGLHEEGQAVLELTKGKRTTQPDGHAGEGIFFTSKAGDSLEIRSHNTRLLFDNTKPDIFVEQIPRRRGTVVRFRIKRRSRKTLSSLFSMFAPSDFDYTFQKTRVSVRLLAERYMSRSEARRLLTGLDKFRTVVLDFQGVAGIGQGFADEVFRVFAQAHPNTSIEATNANAVISAMIAHV